MKWGRCLIFCLVTFASLLAAAASVAQERDPRSGRPGAPRLANSQERPAVGLPPAIQGQPLGLTKTFVPDMIGPGSVSTLDFFLESTSGVGITDIAFVDVLPAGMVIANVPGVVSDCTGTLSAPAGGDTISFSDGTLAAFATCSISVNVTMNVTGLLTNTTGDVTSSAGSGGTATDDLTADVNRPGFLKSFAPSTVALGSRSTLTLTINNTLNPADAFNLSFVDNLPLGLTIADPANASTDCTGGTLTADPGTDTISYGFQFQGDNTILAGASCSLSIDVIASVSGTLGNVSESLLSGDTIFVTARDSGKASAALEVVADPLVLSKVFTDDPVNPGGTVTLEFTILNRDRNFTATDIAFSDDLDATLTGLVATALPMSDVCGAGSTLSGTSQIDLTGGNLAAEASCTFSVTLQVPMAAVPGVYPNTTSQVTGTVGGNPVSGAPALDSLTVNNAPILTKTFLSNPVAAGAAVDVEFTITNPSGTVTLTDITFEDNISQFLSGTTVASLPAAGFCGDGSMATTLVDSGDLVLLIASASLDPMDSCTFAVGLQLPLNAPGGGFLNVTSDVSATADGATAIGDPASDTLFVVAGPTLDKAFTDDPVTAGDTVTLEFTISRDEFSTADATQISFTDDLNAALAGLAAIGLPMNDVCGVGSSISGTTLLTFTGGTLAPAESCTFSVTLQTPAASLPGSYTNVTSDLASMISGIAVASGPATDDLTIAGLTLTKEFTDDPALPGGTVDLEFTISNTTSGSAATNISFNDDIDANLAGLTATGLPLNDVCGTGSSISGTNFLIFVDGSLNAGETCTFNVTLLVPSGAEDGDYPNFTTNLFADIEGQTLVLDPATDSLTVDSSLMAFTKEFTDDPVAPGDNVTLEFAITNLSATDDIVGIQFTDDLDAALSGLVAVGLPIADACGAGSQIAGTSVLTLSDGFLAAGTSCTFSVTLMVPASVPLGTVATNVTSEVQGFLGGTEGLGARPRLGGAAVTAPPATDDLLITFFDFQKSFANPGFPGATVALTFTIENLDTANGFNEIEFSDDLDTVLTGLVAVGLPLNDVCGAGSQISGTSFLTFTGGDLSPGGTCTFDVDVLVPAGAAPGTFPNTTSDLLQNGLTVAPPATDDLTIEPPPTFAKAFAPDVIEVGVASTLTFTIDNSASTVGATGLDFTDNLPANVFVATPANASTTCTGGTVTATEGSGVVAYTGGTVAGGASCTVQADVTSLDAGMYVNTSGDLTSSSGNSGVATDTLTVNRTVSISVTKTDGVTSATPGGTLTYMLSVANGGPSPDMAVGFADTFPVELENCLYTSVAMGGATGNTNGSGDINDLLVMPAASSVDYTVDCDIAGDASGTLSNTATATPSGMDTDPSDDSATDDDTVLGGIADLSLEMTAVYDPAVAATVQVYDVIVSNAGPSTATNAVLNQELPVGAYFLGVEPGSVDCSVSSGIALSCDLGDLAADESVTVSVGAFIDARFDGTLSTDALAESDASDPNPDDNEQEVVTEVARPRTMLATTRADGTEVLAMVAKEADETIGLVFAEAAGGGNRDYSVTGQGFRAVDLAEVPDFDGTAAPEVAALATGFDGSVLVDVVDADSLTLLGSHPVPGNWVPVAIVALDEIGGMTGGLAGIGTPSLALLLYDVSGETTHVIILDAATGATLADYVISGGKGGGAFPIDMAAVESFFGGPVDELAVLTQDPEFEDTLVTLLDPESGFVPNVEFLDSNAFPIAVEGLEDLDGMLGDQGGGGPEVAVLLRDVTTGLANVQIFDAATGAPLPTLSFGGGSLLPEVLTVVPDFAGSGASELSVGGRQAMGLSVETRDASNGMIVGTISIGGGSPLNLDLAVHPSFAGATDPEMSVLFELLGAPTEVNVFDASGGAPLFTFILP